MNPSLFTTASGETTLIAPAVVTPASSQAEQPAAKPIFELRKYGNSSQYSLVTFKDFTVSQDWIKYKLSSASKKGSGFTITSNVDHISKMKFVVMYALSNAEEMAPESYRVLQETQPCENDLAHAAWGAKISNAAKMIEDKLVTSLLKAKAEAAKVDTQEEPAAKKQRKNYEQDLKRKPTINKVKEIIDALQLSKK